MKIYLHEINEKGLEISPKSSDSWVQEAIRAADEKEAFGSESSFPAPTLREVCGTITLRKVDGVFVLSGNLKTELKLLCSRCGNIVAFECSPQFSIIFSKDPVTAGVGYFKEKGRPVKKTKGHSRAHKSENDLLSTDALDINSLDINKFDQLDRDIDVTFLTVDYIDLGTIITEQLQLEIPFQPLCNSDCPGLTISSSSSAMGLVKDQFDSSNMRIVNPFAEQLSNMNNGLNNGLNKETLK